MVFVADKKAPRLSVCRHSTNRHSTSAFWNLAQWTYLQHSAWGHSALMLSRMLIFKIQIALQSFTLHKLTTDVYTIDVCELTMLLVVRQWHYWISLCWVTEIWVLLPRMSFCWVLSLRLSPMRSFIMLTVIILSINGPIRELQLKGKAQYSWPPC